jgi:hypothetical protein
MKNTLESSFFGDPEELVLMIEEAFADLNIGRRVRVYSQWIRRLRQ